MKAEAQLWLGDLVTEHEIVEKGAVVFSADQILWVGPSDQLPEQWKSLTDSTPAGTKYILPGLVDVHCHGGGGASFPDATDLAQVETAAKEHLRHGTTTLVASLVTASIPVLAQRARLLSQAVEQGTIAGIHFEGPFLSEARCGAQDPRYLANPTVDDMGTLIEAANGAARSMTIAPERFVSEEGRASLEVLIRGGAIPSWGHTDAGLEDTAKAVAWGNEVLAKYPTGGLNRASVTHLFNGMRPLHHRDPGPIAEFLSAAAEQSLVVEMICDGVHLQPHLVRNVVEIVGRDNCIFVTDAMAAAGMPDGVYSLGPQQVRVEGGVARLLEADSLAGGSAHLLDCVRVAVQQAGLSLVDAAYLASAQGARLFGWDDLGSLQVGKSSNLVAVDDDLQPKMIVKDGMTVI